MTQPPQYPGHPEHPEQPGGPTPPSTPPGPPPSSPPPSSPPPPPPWGAPPPPSPPPYGAPPQPYGAPPPPYGAYPPGRPGGDGPSKTLAIVALVLAFLGATVVAGIAALVLAIVVLRRGRDGRDHGAGLAVAAIVVSVLMMAAAAVGTVALVNSATGRSIDDLSTGDCIDADGLTDPDADSVGAIEEVDCDERHDAEVIGADELSSGQADAYGAGGFDCAAIVDEDLAGVLADPSYDVFSLTPDPSPRAGDAVVCVAVDAGGDRLRGSLD